MAIKRIIEMHCNKWREPVNDIGGLVGYHINEMSHYISYAMRV